MDAPINSAVPRFVHTHTRFTMAQEMSQNVVAALASAVWPTANKALYIPLVLPFPFNVRRFFVGNGATVNGNWAVNVYSPDGVKLIGSGSTAQSGVSALQYSSGQDYLIPPGAYYLMMVADSGTATYQRQASSSVANMRMWGMLEEAAAFPGPNVMTPVALTALYYPLFGMTSTDTGF